MKKRMNLIVINILLICVALFIMGAAEAEPARVSTRGGVLNMRKEASGKSKIVQKLKNGTIVDVDEKGDEWCHISWNGKSGYVKTTYLKLSSAMDGHEVYSDGETLYLRESPSSDARIIAVVTSQQPVTVLRTENDGWSLVACGSDRGYVRYESISAQNTQAVVAAQVALQQGILLKEQAVYSMPDKSSAVIATLPQGWSAAAARHDQSWCLVRVDGGYGYVPSSSVQLTGADIVNEQYSMLNISGYTANYYTGSIAGRTVTLYAMPTENLQDVWQTVSLSEGETFKVLQRSHAYGGHTWSRIWLNSGLIGWILSEQATFSDHLSSYSYANLISIGANGVAYVSSNGASIYEGPTSMTPVIGTIPANTEVSITVGTAFSGVSWNGLHGWVSNQDIIFGFALSGNWQEEATGENPQPEGTPEGDDTGYIRPEDAKKKASSALKRAFSAFRGSKLVCSYELTRSQYGIKGPLYYIVYSSKNGKYMYGAMIHAETGAVLYTEDYTSYGSVTDPDTPATRKPRPTSTPIPDYPISAERAKSIANQALSAAYGDFDSAAITSIRCNACQSKPGYQGPFWQIDYLFHDDCVFQCIVHCETGEVLYTSDTWDAGLTEIDYNEPTATPAPDTGTRMSEESARSIGEKYLRKKYPAFSSMTFDNAACRLENDFDPSFDIPYYQFDYFLDGQLQFTVIVHAVTGEIEYSSGSMPGDGNG